MSDYEKKKLQVGWGSCGLTQQTERCLPQSPFQAKFRPARQVHRDNEKRDPRDVPASKETDEAVGFKANAATDWVEETWRGRDSNLKWILPT